MALKACHKMKIFEVKFLSILEMFHSFWNRLKWKVLHIKWNTGCMYLIKYVHEILSEWWWSFSAIVELLLWWPVDYMFEV